MWPGQRVSGRRKEGVWPTPSSVGCTGKGAGRGLGKGGGASFSGAKLGSQDNSGKAAYFSSRPSGDLEKIRGDRGGCEASVGEEGHYTAPVNPEPTCVTRQRDGLLGSHL